MIVSAKLASIKSNTPAEYAIRFLLGGAICVAAGLTSKHFGPIVGGLLLAFPAIFPCSDTLLAAHEERKKAAAGLSGMKRGRLAAALDADGTALGALGLAAFALLLWITLPRWNAALALTAAALLWFGVSVLLWQLRRKL